MKISIIGTAGRKEPLERKHLVYMFKRAKGIVEAQLCPVTAEAERHVVTLVSGGAAGADHVAVLLAKDLNLKLELRLPCAWDHEAHAYQDSGVRDWRKNPGGTSNYYHRLFSKACWENEKTSLEHIHEALESPWADGIVGTGFFERNSEVAKADKILAFTFGEGREPTDGGTLDTWKKARALGRDCLHISLAGV